MKVLNINNYNQTNFRALERTVYKVGKPALEENILHRNNTYSLRSDIDWLNLAKTTLEKFINVDKVFTAFYACSDGREAQSFLLTMDSIFGEKALEKFTPIHAIDYDSFAINLAKNNFYEFSEAEIRRIDAVTGGRFSDYYKPASKLDNRYKATKKLTDRIIYEVGDFTKEYQNLPKEKVLLSVRNCWPYFSMSNQYTLPRKVCNHFDRDAMILLGDFDLTTQETYDFMHNGFKVADIESLKTVFVK